MLGKHWGRLSFNYGASDFHFKLPHEISKGSYLLKAEVPEFEQWQLGDFRQTYFNIIISQ